VANTLANLGVLLWNTGDLAAAHQRLSDALVLRRRLQAPGDPRIAVALNALGLVLRDEGDLAGARTALEEAVAIRRCRLPGHPLLASALNNLGQVLRSQGETGAARRLHEEALAVQDGRGQPGKGADCSASVRADLLPAGHPDRAVTLAALGEIEGDPGRAVELLSAALALREQALGTAHPLTAQSRAALARALLESGQRENALATALAAESAGRAHLGLTIRTLAEREALRYSAVRASGLDVALTLADGQGRGPAVAAALDALVRSRAFVLDEMASRHRIPPGERADVAAARAALTEAGQRLSNLLVRGVGAAEAQERYRGLVDAARAAREQAERSLARRRCPVTPCSSPSCATSRSRGGGGASPCTRRWWRGAARCRRCAWVVPSPWRRR
jgi:tetratricopeptide (TPR) repeat protein